MPSSERKPLPEINEYQQVIRMLEERGFQLTGSSESGTLEYKHKGWLVKVGKENVEVIYLDHAEMKAEFDYYGAQEFLTYLMNPKKFKRPK